MRAGADCPHKHEHVARGHAPREVCDWHRRTSRGVSIVWPLAAQAWAERVAARR
jgi:hypothetical protein